MTIYKAYYPDGQYDEPGLHETLTGAKQTAEETAEINDDGPITWDEGQEDGELVGFDTNGDRYTIRPFELRP